MTLAETLVVRSGADLLDAHLTFQRAAGVDLVLAAVEPRSGGAKALEGRDGVEVVPDPGGGIGALRTRLARRALEAGASWVLHAEPNEFWWPRGESLRDVLAPIPPRYTVVQALRRELVAEPAGEENPFLRATRRRPVVQGTSTATLRPVHRVDAAVEIDDDGGVTLPRRVPLRAWYPIEVLTLVEATPGDDGLVVDTRLRDAIAADAISFRTPDVVADAAYAVECAAVGEVDLPRLEAYIEELEQRVAWLEQRLWPRLLRRAGRLVGR